MNDPRRHRRVRAVRDAALTYVCGCVNEIDGPSGVLRSVSKCARHALRQRPPEALDGAYYQELGTVRDGRPAPAAHPAELCEALGPFPPAPPGGRALEVGCGASPYVPAVRAAGYLYVGLDPSDWAAQWTATAFGVDVLPWPVERLFGVYGVATVSRAWPLILAAHVLEHVADAPATLRGLANMLAPGGELWVVVPDDEDPLNPDHLWFFDADTLRACARAAGLEVVREAVRRHVPHESFLYLRARRSGPRVGPGDAETRR